MDANESRTRDRARAENLAARFVPITKPDNAGPLPRWRESGSEEPAELPGIIVAGVHVFAYVDGSGAFRVSLHLDTGDGVPEWLIRGDDDGTMPLRIDVNGAPVFDDTDEARAEAATTWGKIAVAAGNTAPEGRAKWARSARIRAAMVTVYGLRSDASEDALRRARERDPRDVGTRARLYLAEYAARVDISADTTERVDLLAMPYAGRQT